MSGVDERLESESRSWPGFRWRPSESPPLGDHAARATTLAAVSRWLSAHARKRTPSPMWTQIAIAILVLCISGIYASVGLAGGTAYLSVLSASLVGFLVRGGQLDMGTIAVMGGCVFVGGFIGARYGAGRASPRVLQVVFGIVALTAGVRLAVLFFTGLAGVP